MRQSKRMRVGEPKDADADRRASTRFSLNLEVRYTILGGNKPVRVGVGRTIDVSSSGLRFMADTPMLTGQKIVVHIDWPVLLDGDTKLQLVISGVVVRTDGTEAALQIQRHDFRTRHAGQGPPLKSVG
jgi:hypothetical protein